MATLAALHSGMLGEELAKLARYKRLVCPEEITRASGGDDWGLR
ncbi:MAG: hypothetical protein ABSC94_13935 [Polyangiaceae bacterium]